MLNNEKNILEEEIKLLIRAVRNELFHFIIVQYNHYDLVRRVKKELNEIYTNKSSHNFNLEEINQESFIHDIFECKSGLVFIEKFELIFTEEFRSLAIGFNQRRDKFSDFPMQIILFLPFEEKHIHDFKKKLPDVFSIVNPIIQLRLPLSVGALGNDNNEYESVSDFSNLNEAQQEIIRIEERLKNIENGPENTQLIRLLKSNLAKAYIFLANYEKGKSILEQLLNEVTPMTDKGSEEDKLSLENDLALVLKDLGDYENAKKLLQNVMVSNETKYGENHPFTSISYSNLGTILLDLGEYEEAEKLLKKAIVSDEKNFGLDHPKTAMRYSNLATVLRTIGEHEKAKELLQKAIISDEKNFGKNHPKLATRYSNMALILEDLGEYSKAKELLEKTIIIDEKNFGVNHPSTAIGYSNLAFVLQDLHMYQESKEYFEKALDVFLNTLNENHPNIEIAKNNLQQLLDVIKKPHEK